MTATTARFIRAHVYKEGSMEIDWQYWWPIIWEILKPALIAAITALLGILGYDKTVPSRYERKQREANNE